MTQIFCLCLYCLLLPANFPLLFSLCLFKLSAASCLQFHQSYSWLVFSVVSVRFTATPSLPACSTFFPKEREYQRHNYQRAETINCQRAERATVRRCLSIKVFCKHEASLPTRYFGNRYYHHPSYGHTVYMKQMNFMFRFGLHP
jgi:hypothetical protein